VTNAVQFGAGNIGRGLVGYVLRRAGYDVIFVDVVDDVVRQLNILGRYAVRILTREGERLETIDGVRAVHAADVDTVVGAVAGADLVTTAVGPGVLPAVAEPIRDGLRRHPAAAVNVIACENMTGNSTRLRSLVEGQTTPAVPAWAGFPDCVVDRIVTGATDPQQPFAVTVEESFEFLVARGGWVGPVPRIDGVMFVEDLEPYRVRKLWLVNGLHAAVAYLGAQRRYRRIDEAMRDPVIQRIVEGAAAESVAALHHLHPVFAHEELTEYASRNLARFRDPRLSDPIARVARDPLRKLGAGDRLCGPARVAVDAGLPARDLARAIAAALAYRGPDDPSAVQLGQAVERQGWRATLMQLANLPPQHPLLELVAEAQGDQRRAGSPQV
jgi:mannitol-1-phosphate 5-dehydrogenase